MRVLLIQQQTHARRLFKHLLDSQDCVVSQSASLEDAAAEFKRGPFDLVFVDEPLPGLRTSEAIRRLRAIAVTGDAIIVALINRASERELPGLVAAGANEFMVLPAPLEEVQLRLSVIVEMAKKIGRGAASSDVAAESADKFFESMPDAAFLLDRVGTLIAVNRRLAELTGYTVGQLVGQPAEYIGLPMAEEIPTLLEKSASASGRMEKITLVRRDMKPVPAIVRYAWLDSDARSIVVGVARESDASGPLEDTSTSKNEEPAALEFDRRGIVRSVSPQLAKLLGTSREKFAGKSLRDIVHRQDLGEIPRLIAPEDGDEGNCNVGALRLRQGSGEWLTLEMSGHAIEAVDGADRFVISVGHSGPTERVSRSDHAAVDEHVDALTGLPDRIGFVGKVTEAIRVAGGNDLVAILFLNVDRFKHINEKHGYAVGDRLVTDLARRIEGLLGRADTLGRVGGDEFAILAASAGSHAESLRFGERIVNDLAARPFHVHGHTLYVTASIGIALGEAGAFDPAELLRQADGAAVQAKRGGRGRVHIYESRLEKIKSDKLTLEQDLMQALRRDELVVYYQPEVDLQTGAILGVEALVRWNHPKHGLIAPARFIPTAESTGLLDPITLWVLEAAARHTSAWISRFKLPDFSVSVNFSADQFHSGQLITDVSAALRRAGLPPSALRVEITESVLIEDEPEVVKRMTQLRKLGVHLAIDDFGTGYASFSYLRSLPIDMLKVDRSFVSGSGATSGELSLTRSMATLAREEGLALVVEGIESASQLKRVQDYGCTAGQGYYFSRPVGPETIEFLLMAGPYPFANMVRPMVEAQDQSSSAAAS